MSAAAAQLTAHQSEQMQVIADELVDLATARAIAVMGKTPAAAVYRHTVITIALVDIIAELAAGEPLAREIAAAAARNVENGALETLGLAAVVQ